jgi:hypothetical protein
VLAAAVWIGAGLEGCARPAFDSGEPCISDHDCQSGVCVAQRCSPAPHTSSEAPSAEAGEDASDSAAQGPDGDDAAAPDAGAASDAGEAGDAVK